jgi:hypothetical protein
MVQAVRAGPIDARTEPGARSPGGPGRAAGCAGLLLLLAGAAGCPHPLAPTEPLPALRAVTVEPAFAAVAPGDRLPLVALGHYHDGSVRDLTAAATWSTGSGAVAAVEAPGVVAGRAPGAAAVEAAWGGRRGRAAVAVDAAAPALRSLEVEPRQATLEAGGALAFLATGRYADGSARDLTRVVRWSSPGAGPGGFPPGGPPGTWVAAGPGRARVEARLGAARAEASLEVEAHRAAAPAAFPLRVAPNGRFLVDQRGVPFRIHGEAAWSLIANLTAAEVDGYLEDRRRKGFNAILVNLVEHRYAADPPRNRAGAAPFRTPGDLAEPDDAYFDFAVSALEAARARGFLVLLVPAYPGFGCPTEPSPENDGWSAEMWHSPPAACREYGRYVGRRFAAFDDVVWVQGGDCTPPRGSELEACALQVMAGIREAAPGMLQTGHWRPHSTSLDEPAFAPEMQLDAVYRYRTPHAACRQAYARSPARPAFLIETGYEGETIDGSSLPTRKYQWWASLGCTAGQFFGSRPGWSFGPGWRQALGSAGAQDMARLGGLLDSVPWETLVPSGLGGARVLVTGGSGAEGGQDEVVSAAASDGTALVAYVPPTGAGPRSLVVDLSALSGPGTARWFDPSGGGWVEVGRVPGGGRRWLTTPGRRPGGLDDWVLVITRAAEQPGRGGR